MNHDDLLNLLTACLGVGTFALALIALLQRGWMKTHATELRALATETKAIALAAKDSADAAQASVTLATTTLNQVERPWLTFWSPTIKMPESGPFPAQLKLTVLNSGRTPAIITSSILEYSIGQPPHRGSFSPQNEGGDALGPNQTKEYTLGTLPKSELAMHPELFVFFEITYLDVVSTDQTLTTHSSSNLWKLRTEDMAILQAPETVTLGLGYRVFT